MKLKAKFMAPLINIDKFRNALHQKLSEALTQACVTWLNTVIKESTAVGLPIWSGASISTFTPLASQVGFELASGPIEGVKKRVADGVGLFEPGTKQAGLYTFTYATDLKHLTINEYRDVSQWIHLKTPGPYHFQEKGKNAFLEFAKTIELPGWGEFTDVTVIGVG